MFDPTSRYYRLETAILEMPDRSKILYMKRRLLPKPDGAALSQEAIQPGDRLDLIASRVFGDPALYWRICDANDTLNPFDLLDTAGGTLNIPSPGVDS